MLPRKVQAAWQGRDADARRDAPTARQQALLGDPQAQAQQRRAPAARLTRAPPCLPGWPRAPRGGSWAPPRAACPPRPAANPPRCPQSRQRPATPCAATPERMAGASGVFLRTGVEQLGSSGRAASFALQRHARLCKVTCEGAHAAVQRTLTCQPQRRGAARLSAVSSLRRAAQKPRCSACGSGDAASSKPASNAANAGRSAPPPARAQKRGPNSAGTAASHSAASSAPTSSTCAG